jgi:copper oxidase (laccase) domain-containing protein
MQRHAAPGQPPYWTFPLLEGERRLACGVFSSEGPDGTGFNLSYEHGEEGETFARVELARRALGLPEPFFLNQAHGDGILELPDGPTFSPRSQEESPRGYDGMLGGPGQALMIKLADCQGLLLWSPETLSLALVHSGWKGSRLDIAGQAVARLVKSKGADPERMLACVTPSIGPCCMEFKGYRELLPEALWRYRVPGTENFDFWALTRDQLLARGIPESNIFIPGVCTRCGTGFYSHRRGDRGRFAVMAGVSFA